MLISKGNIEAHGGRIWASLSEQGGAEFSFVVPVGIEHDASL